jgi:hypothetical protein
MDKQEIVETRIGGLGSSDAKMVCQIGETQNISEAASSRIAIMLGLDEQKVFSTAATKNGVIVEDELFRIFKETLANVVSNPFTEMESSVDKYGFKVFNHIDFENESDDTITWWECKATNKSTEETLKTYTHQLEWHNLLLQEKAKKLGKKAVLNLIHYLVTDVNSDELVFDETNLKVVEFESNSYIAEHILKGLDFISKALPTFTYDKKEEISAYTLPANVQESLEEIATFLYEIKERESKIELFKENMAKQMEQYGVKSIKNDLFNITLVPETQATTFDSKKLQKEMPEIYGKYTRISNKKSFIKITLKN